MFITKAVKNDQMMAMIRKREPRTEQEILEVLAAGNEVKHGTDWYNLLRDADAQAKPKPQKNDYPNGRVLDCGCTVYNRGEVMNASMGSSCANCYDLMSN
jgi:hypothetical protein